MVWTKATLNSRILDEITVLEKGAQVSRFDVLENNGKSGQFAEVFPVYDKKYKLKLALKVGKKTDGDTVSRFEKEYEALSNLDHPNIIKLYEKVHADFPILLLELANSSLSEEMILGPKDLPFIKNTIDQLCDALHYAHTREPKPVIHRDIKPSNVLFFDNGVVKISDYGAAGIVDSSGISSGLIGTETYLAREGFTGDLIQSKKNLTTIPADLYPLGVMIFEMCLPDVPLFLIPSSIKTIENPDERQKQQYERLREIKSSTDYIEERLELLKEKKVDKNLVSIIRVLIDPEPKNRYQSAEDLKKALQPQKPKPRPGKKETKKRSTQTGARPPYTKQGKPGIYYPNGRDETTQVTDRRRFTTGKENLSNLEKEVKIGILKQEVEANQKRNRYLRDFNQLYQTALEYIKSPEVNKELKVSSPKYWQEVFSMNRKLNNLIFEGGLTDDTDVSNSMREFKDLAKGRIKSESQEVENFKNTNHPIYVKPYKFLFWTLKEYTATEEIMRLANGYEQVMNTWKSGPDYVKAVCKSMEIFR